MKLCIELSPVTGDGMEKCARLALAGNGFHLENRPAEIVSCHRVGLIPQRATDHRVFVTVSPLNAVTGFQIGSAWYVQVSYRPRRLALASAVGESAIARCPGTPRENAANGSVRRLSRVAVPVGVAPVDRDRFSNHRLPFHAATASARSFAACRVGLLGAPNSCNAA